jgi:photosystem II stability/assembly factor-like uncharacterized protein
MRKIIILPAVFIFLLFQSIRAQHAWDRIVNLPQENTINDMARIPGTDRIVAVGEGSTVMYSEDHGESWVVKCNPAGLNNFANLKSVCFSDANTGFISTSNALILRTSDGGNSWTQVFSGEPAVSFNDVYFIDEYIGFACGDEGRIIKSTDSGLSWNYTDSSVTENLPGIDFVSDSLGFILTGSSDFFLETVDGGQTWQAIAFSPPLELSWMSDLQFVNDSTGFVFGTHQSMTDSYGKVYKTTDAGATWSEVLHESNLNQGSMVFYDESHGFIAFHRWLEVGIRFTSDGGITWQETQLPPPSYLFDIHSAIYFTPYITLAAGSSCLLIRSTNGCVDWENLSESSFTFPVENVQFVNSNTGFALDNADLRGMAGKQLWKTTDEGQSWIINRTLWGYGGCFHFPDETNGFAASSDFTDELIFYRTMDCGENWEETNFIMDFFPSDIRFHDLQSGIIAGDKILKTIDGGNSWEVAHTGSGNYLRIFYSSADEIVIVGEHSLIFSTDGGLSWTERGISDATPVSNAFMKDDETIFITLGETIYWSDDQGINWNPVTMDNANPVEFKSIFFSSANVGFAAGQGPYETMLKTTDGGLTWNVIDVPASSALSCIWFFDDLHGFVYGEKGLVLETHTGGVVGIAETEREKELLAGVIYPNPFSDKFSIDLGEAWKGQPVILEIYDPVGRLILKQTIVSQRQQITFPDAGKGLYFYRLLKEKRSSEMRKLIKF